MFFMERTVKTEKHYITKLYTLPRYQYKVLFSYLSFHIRYRHLSLHQSAGALSLFAFLFFVSLFRALRVFDMSFSLFFVIIIYPFV